MPSSCAITIVGNGHAYASWKSAVRRRAGEHRVEQLVGERRRSRLRAASTVRGGERAAEQLAERGVLGRVVHEPGRLRVLRALPVADRPDAGSASASRTSAYRLSVKNGGVNSVRGTGQRARSSAYAGKGSASVASENGSYVAHPCSRV